MDSFHWTLYFVMACSQMQLYIPMKYSDSSGYFFPLQFILHQSHSIFKDLTKSNSSICFIETSSTIFLESPWIYVVKEEASSILAVLNLFCILCRKRFWIFKIE